MSELGVLVSGECEPDANMAFDEAMLVSMPDLRIALMRFYGWTLPAATFGYFQAYETVAALTSLRPLVRRPTGGGIVPHDRDWTYSMAFPSGHEWYGLKAVESYRRVHEWIRLAFERLGLETELAPSKLVTGPGQCFAGYEQFDLLWHGRKIAGAAQRRTKDGLLIQGSVQCPRTRLPREQWEAAMQDVAGTAFGLRPVPFAAPDELERKGEQLRATKYSTEAYNRKK